jgi:HK97 family phage major capsid protein
MDKLKKLRQLQQQKSDLVAQAGELLNKETVTDEDLTAAKAKQAEAAKLNAQIDALQAQIDMEASLEVVATVEADEPAKGNAQVKKPVFATFGEQLQAIVKSSMPGAQVDARLLEVQAAASGGAAAVPSDGGYMIQSDFASEIIKNTYDASNLAGKCQTVEVGGDGLIANTVDETSRATGSRMGGIQVYRANEADTVTAKKPKFGKIELKLEKLMGLAYMTEELMEDAPALESIYKQGFADEFAFVLDDEIIRGTGAGQCLGILNSGALISVSKETGQAADTLVKENIDKMWSRMTARNRANAVWLINQEVETQLDDLQMVIGTAGVPVYMPPGGLSDTPYARLKGRPVLPIEQASALGDLGDIMLVDMSQYLLIKKGGLKQDMSMHVRFIYGENTFRFTMRNNGQPIPRTAITPYKGTNTLSPFVALAARA